ncbi:CD9 antigen [Liparis tanakae]|uniref:CD9 antigen n=1 Tax=Liparis tanakae TaxID=230148 RepID=A0A4Z2G2H8_9TELE|nr:CD9 antigen [Liparis tanakae]
MALDGCGLFCKYTLIIFNLIFAVVGLAFLGIGLWLRFSNGTRGIFEIEALDSSAFVTAVTILIALGAVMLVVVVFGDYGACNEKRCALLVFCVLVAILAVADVAVGVVGFNNKDSVGAHIVEFYASMYGLYVTGKDPVIGVTLRFIHSLLHCCGVTGFTALELVNDTCPPADGFFENFKMPGCPAIILSVFDSKAELMLGIFIGTGALLVVALVCSAILCKKIRRCSSPFQTMVMTQSTSVRPIPPHGLVSTSYPAPYLYPDPVVFTPLSVAKVMALVCTVILLKQTKRDQQAVTAYYTTVY